jgi:uncharacterized RDD family membrane protein YckC
VSDWGNLPPPPSGSGYPPPGYGGYQQQGYGYVPGGGPQILAGFWIRFAASLVDGIILAIPNFILREALFSDRTTGVTFGVGFTPGTAFAYQLLTWLLSLAYYAFQEGSPSGQTLGKRVCGIRVVDAASARPGIGAGRAAVRYLVSIVSGIVIGLGYLWMLWDRPLRQTWHDKAARTTVVKA